MHHLSTRSPPFQTLQTLMRALAPILTHTIEELYQTAPPALRAALRLHCSFQVPQNAAAAVAAEGKSKSADEAFDSVFCHGWFQTVRGASSFVCVS